MLTEGRKLLGRTGLTRIKSKINCQGGLPPKRQSTPENSETILNKPQRNKESGRERERERWDRCSAILFQEFDLATNLTVAVDNLICLLICESCEDLHDQ